MKTLRVAPSPHIYTGETVNKMMYGVLIALIPAFLVSVFYFGMGAIYITLTAVASCMLTEFAITKYMLKKESTITDGSAAITGVLLAFNLPTNLPIWIVILGSFFAIAIAKMAYGGLGNNPFNPALIGRVFLLVSFPVQMTSWPVPMGFATKYVDAVTGPTPLALIKEGLKKGDSITSLLSEIPSYMDMFIGKMGGSMGEISALALIIGGIYLLYRKIITWHIPVITILTVFVFAGILWFVSPDKNMNPMFHLLTGGLMLGAIFMATDYATSPMTLTGIIIYSIGIGVITVLIRVFGAYPEGVSFAILIMNAFVPIMNRYFKPKRFGEEVKNG